MIDDGFLFTELVERLLTQRLQRFVGLQTTEKNVNQIYDTINSTLQGVLQKCEFDLSSRARSYLIYGYFSMIKINGKELPATFKNNELNRSNSVEELSRSELDLFRWLLVGHDLHDEIEQENQRRNSFT